MTLTQELAHLACGYLVPSALILNFHFTSRVPYLLSHSTSLIGYREANLLKTTTATRTYAAIGILIIETGDQAGG